MQATSIENQIFDWQDWEQIDTGCIQFINCTVVSDFGPYEAGDAVPCIEMDYEHSIIICYNDAVEEVYRGYIEICIND